MIKKVSKTFKKLLKPTGKIKPKDIAIIILTIIVISLGMSVLKTAFVLLRRWLLPNLHMEGFDGKKEFVLLHMDGCPHCVKMLPEWKSATSSNTTSINMRSLERKDDGARDLIEKHGVSSFPTMLLLGGGKLLKKYDGQRNKNSFLDFLRKHD